MSNVTFPAFKCEVQRTTLEDLNKCPIGTNFQKKSLEIPIATSIQKYKTMRSFFLTALTQKTKKVSNNQTNNATVLKKSGNQRKKNADGISKVAQQVSNDCNNNVDVLYLWV